MTPGFKYLSPCLSIALLERSKLLIIQSTKAKTEEIRTCGMPPCTVYGDLAAFDAQIREWSYNNYHFLSLKIVCAEATFASHVTVNTKTCRARTIWQRFVDFYECE